MSQVTYTSLFFFCVYTSHHIILLYNDITWRVQIVNFLTSPHAPSKGWKLYASPTSKYVLCDFAYVIGHARLLQMKIHDLKQKLVVSKLITLQILRCLENNRFVCFIKYLPHGIIFQVNIVNFTEIFILSCIWFLYDELLFKSITFNLSKMYKKGTNRRKNRNEIRLTV
jgi:hypothetical protein